MKLKNLDMHCINCPDDLMELCDRYTPYDSTKIPLCCFEKFQNLDDKKDINEIRQYCEKNLEEWEEIEKILSRREYEQ